MGVAQISRARLTQVLVFGSIYQGAIMVNVFDPQPNEFLAPESSLRIEFHIGGAAKQLQRL